MATITPEVAAFLLDMLGRQILNATADDLLPVATLCVQARQQLETVLVTG